MWLLPPRLLLPIISGQYERWPLAQQGMARLIRGLRRYETVKIRLAINWIDFTPRLSTVGCPVLGLVGDSSDDLVRFMRRLTAAIPHARLEFVTAQVRPVEPVPSG